MALPLSPEENQRYTIIIDTLLENADLTTVSRKTIRQGLENGLGGRDLSDYKVAIKALIEARFDALANPSPSASPKRSASESASSAEETDDRPTKKPKRECSIEDSDAKLAAELQAQENSLARGRRTRGASSSGKATPKPKKKTPRKKSAPKVKSGDSDDNASDGSTPTKKRGGGFNKPFNLSEHLIEVCGGETQLPRPQVVKRLWAYIRENELQNPRDKREILCDEKLQAIFKGEKVTMFSMNKLLGSHLYPVEEE